MTSFPNFENNLVDDAAENMVVFSVTNASDFEIKSGDTRKDIFVMKSYSCRFDMMGDFHDSTHI